MSNQKSSVKTTSVQIDHSTIEQLRESLQEEAQTIVHCNYVSKRKYVNGGWVNIYPTTYLVHNDEKLQLIHAENIPFAPAIHKFNRSGELKRFTLIFPSIPKDWDSFSLIEDSGTHECFSVHNIQANHSGVYEVAIH